MTIVPFEARRFRTTADYYSRFRVPYPDRLIERVAERTGLKPGERVLDLGCGPAPLGVAFARLAGADVIGVDPEPEMLDVARGNAAEASVSIRLVQGSSYDLSPDLAPLKLAVMGRSFHWMDRPATLAALDKLIATGGAVVLFSDRHISATPDWRDVLHQLSEAYSPERSAERQQRRGVEFGPHETILLRSSFRKLERIGIVNERLIGTDDIVGRAFSMSVTSLQALGDKAQEFEAAFRSELAALSPNGKFTEIVEGNALIAFRD
ncbi:SAM-dependent methyltransferase [Rhizobium sp. BK650]|uniref:class I SAM-dependent methyltransferase n=1 Tax=Rhizobium sp. BK650 TaxID=2586990 RepID=UPI00160B602E|nr:class I SAM-dependent methyltransferase [Rhizobium sp. BK650]MBB3658974.1 SAM-dependent methyltransferase [Rhizobium sp. BK650]